MGTIYVNEDWTAVVPAGSPDAAFGVQEKDLRRMKLGHLLDAPSAEETEEPQVMASANLLKEADPPEDKAAPRPEDKQAAPVEDKAVRKPPRGR